MYTRTSSPGNQRAAAGLLEAAKKGNKTKLKKLLREKQVKIEAKNQVGEGVRGGGRAWTKKPDT